MKKILLSSLLVSSLVMAADANYDESNKLITHTEFGYISTSGNTETKTYSLDSKIKKGFDKHLLALSFDGQYAEDSDIETKNKYLIELTYNYELTSKLAFKYLFGYKDDKFSGYNYQLYTGPGVSYKALELENQNLSLDSIVLYSKDKLDGSNAISNDYTSLRVNATYEWQVLEDLKFTQEASYRTDIEDVDNYFVFSKTAFSSKISDIFSAGISYKVDYTNLEASGKESTDKTLTANLSIDY